MANEVKEAIMELIDTYGIHAVSLALMQATDDMAYRTAKNEQNVTLGKKWAACSDAAVIFEHAVLLQFGDNH